MDSEQKTIGHRHLVAFSLIAICILGSLYAGARGNYSLGGYLLLAGVVLVLANWVWTFPRTVRYLWKRFLK